MQILLQVSRKRDDYYYSSESEKQKMRRREAWMKEQELQRRHEELKRKKIEEYERRRAEELKNKRNGRSPRRSRSRSEEFLHKAHSKSMHNSNKIMSEKTISPEGNDPFFKGPDDFEKYSSSSLRDVKVTVHRNFPTEALNTQSDVTNGKEVIVIRRPGNVKFINRVSYLLASSSTLLMLNTTLNWK